MKLGDEKKGDVNRCSPRFSANFFFFNGEEIGDVIKKRKENPCKVVSFFM